MKFSDEQLQEIANAAPIICEKYHMARELLELRTAEQVFVCQAPGSPGPIFAFKGKLSDVKPTWKILDQTREL